MRHLMGTALICVLGCHFSAAAKISATMPVSCEGRLIGGYIEREFKLLPPNWDDNADLIRADMEQQAWSAVRTHFDRSLDTQIYYTATGAPDKDGRVPLVDADSAAVFVFIHGSGTGKSSGSNFVANMSALSNLGYSAVSLDLPFHMSGPLSEKFLRSDYFLEWFDKFMKSVKAAGKPVYLIGHSFGPDVILEYVSRNPHAVDGVLAMSPAGFDRVTREWYVKYTSKMRFGGEVTENTMGGRWAGAMSDQFLWSRGGLEDPTAVNPELKLRVLSGNREEYIPAPTGGPNKTPVGPNTYDISRFFRQRFAGAVVTIEDGIGHYLFDFKDKSGQLVVMRELLSLVGEKTANAKALSDHSSRIRDARPASVRMATLAQTDLVFQAWLKKINGERNVLKILRDRNDEAAGKVLADFAVAKEARYKQMMQMLYDTAVTAPEFFGRHRNQIETARSKGRIDNSLLALYYTTVLGRSVSIN